MKSIYMYIVWVSMQTSDLTRVSMQTSDLTKEKVDREYIIRLGAN